MEELYTRVLRVQALLGGSNSQVVDGAPKNVKEGVSKEEAEAAKAALEAEGAKITLK